VEDDIVVDIVDRLRSWGPMWRPQDQISIDMNDAADEIQRLRRNIGCARDQRSTQYCAEALDAQREMERLRAELVTMTEMFNAARRSTAPTPANTGGGADHQIPEAL
jgi:hypothetical protein